MIHGVGIDIVDVKRIEQATGRWGERFLKKVFTDAEISYCYTRFAPYNSLAVRFAGKEAFVKAFQTGEAISLRDIEILVDGKTGKPAVILHGATKQAFKSNIKKGIIHVSLSHDGGSAIASVIIEDNQ
ncbi:holo-[acyl-carrier-protein] synthase [bacterium BMS3Bbin06]|nr:holo-[acyl-carrier-protein] synthase [bacterium BMS3Abin08]GBE35605.1 holo-[acyl-carrier-protein] synthase [bacterium BMS3Bbin06]HDO36547.1 holo-[acyl-carrier-protein] synthase [Nitrospirota bacterium]HDY72304.1 holo-[acyl-carrier-protein] synthase [Nitrospirota bacterium]